VRTLAKRIALARTAAGSQSQSELARRMGVTPTNIQQWENGDTSPRARRLRKLAEELGEDEFY
jgi:transcriptional regulator with XRE-family HTH domain